jgi:glycosyltransferase involved in cell wall biosynthesis
MIDTTAVVACFNYGEYVGEAVASLLDQEDGGVRVVVVDDGSTDPGTHAALDALPGEVELIRQPNRGVVAARNAGLKRVRTPYWICLDADDRLAPGALAHMRRALELEPGVSFAYGHHQYFGDWTARVRFPPYDALRLLDRHLIGLTALARRELLEDTGGFDPSFDAFEDWELWINALAHGHRGTRVDVVTLEYRRHGQSKVGGDRHAYRRTRRRLHQKHAALYRSRVQLADESSLGALGRLVYRAYWGPRPLPAAVERGIYEVVLRSLTAARRFAAPRG